MTTVFGRSDDKLLGAVMTDSLHRDWPGQVQWVCSQPPRCSRAFPRFGQHPSLMSIFGRRSGRCKGFLRRTAATRGRRHVILPSWSSMRMPRVTRLLGPAAIPTRLPTMPPTINLSVRFGPHPIDHALPWRAARMGILPSALRSLSQRPLFLSDTAARQRLAMIVSGQTRE